MMNLCEQLLELSESLLVTSFHLRKACLNQTEHIIHVTIQSGSPPAAETCPDLPVKARTALNSPKICGP